MRRLTKLKLFRALLLGALSVNLFAGCSTSSKAKEEASIRSQIGVSFMDRGNYPAALREFLQAEKLDPKNTAVQNNLGLVYFFRQKYDLASRHLSRAVEIDPTYSEARNNYARILIEINRFDEAAQQLDLVFKDLTYVSPEKASINYGLLYFKKKDFEKAREKFAEAVAINRNNCLAQTLYGRSLLELGKGTSAAEALDNAIVVCRPIKYDEPFYYSGLAYYKLGRTSAAIARMEEIVKLYPQGNYAAKAESMLKLMR